MPTNNVMYAGPGMVEFLLDDYEKRKREVRIREHRYYSQREHADYIGIIPQTFGRFLNGDKTMGVDSADKLLRHYKGRVVNMFDYREESYWDRTTVELLASLYEMVDRETAGEPDDDIRNQKRENIAKAISELARMDRERRGKIINLILRVADHPDSGEIDWQNLLTAA